MVLNEYSKNNCYISLPLLKALRVLVSPLDESFVIGYLGS
jgi:hypothetical protein